MQREVIRSQKTNAEKEIHPVQNKERRKVVMKKHPIGIKKFLAALIAILMLLSLSVSGFAAGGANGSVVTTADIETCIEKHYGFLMRHFLELSLIHI